MADITRVARPWFSMASWRARALITVPSMPIRSLLARFIPAIAPVAPRQMLPPPTTTASSSPPRSMAWAISRARKSTVVASIVSSLAAEARASPESLRTTRRTELAPDHHLGVSHDGGRTEELRDGLLVVLREGLIEQDALLEPAVEPAFDDLGQRRLGLALVARDLLDGDAFGGNVGLGHVRARQVLRAGERDVDRDVVGDVGAGAAHDHGHADDAAPGLLMNVGLDDLAVA